MDVSQRALEIAKTRLDVERMPEAQRNLIELLQGALTYRDKRFEGFDAACAVEVSSRRCVGEKIFTQFFTQLHRNRDFRG